jgi:hypothetical protein
MHPRRAILGIVLFLKGPPVSLADTISDKASPHAYGVGIRIVIARSMARTEVVDRRRTPELGGIAIRQKPRQLSQPGLQLFETT